MSKNIYQTVAAKILNLPHVFSRQGTLVSAHRIRNGKKFGPYFRLAYRDHENRQRSIYLGPDKDTALRIQSLLDELKAPLNRRREGQRLRSILLAALRRQKGSLDVELRSRGLYLKGYSVRGWRRLNRSYKHKNYRGIARSNEVK